LTVAALEGRSNPQGQMVLMVSTLLDELGKVVGSLF